MVYNTVSTFDRKDMKRDFISLDDYSAEDLHALIDLAQQMKGEPGRYSDGLKGKTLGMIFNKRSTRTRISFEVGMLQLGGWGLFFSPTEMQLSRGESIPDTARVLSRYVDGIMIRTYDHADLIEFARHASIPIINGLTDYNHPCQAMADVLTIKEHFGEVTGRKMAYLGDSNNVTVSLLAAGLKFGMNMAVVSPEGYTLDPSLVETVQNSAEACNLTIEFTSDVEEGVAGADVVYTDTWTSMGQEEEHEKRLHDLADYQVNDRVMAAAGPKAIFMHCLPAHRGEEVTDEVMDGPQSLVWEQAENRLHAQKAILYTLMK
jgi:ornithine carbamoyltransferase